MRLSSVGIKRKFASRKRRIGKRKAISEPSKMAKPTSQISIPRYIGFRLNPKGPPVINASEALCSSYPVCASRNELAVQVVFVDFEQG
jgi:hypothetical protein